MSANLQARAAARAALMATVSAAIGAAAMMASAPAEAKITKIEVTKEGPTFDGKSFGAVGQYEKLYGKAFGEVDPKDPRNAVIVESPTRPRTRAAWLNTAPTS